MINKHMHGGKSSREFLDAFQVLKRVGLKKGQVFLDAGCGDGHFSFAASEIVGKTGKVFAVDIHEESIKNLKEEVAKQGRKNIEVILADLTQLVPLKKESVDFCLLANVLHGAVINKEAETMLGEISRVLKSGGKLAVVEFAKKRDIPGPSYEEKLSPQEVKEVVLPLGFSEGGVLSVGPYHYAVVFAREKRARR